MPEIIPLPFDPRILSLSAERKAKRSEGIHLSTIIRDRLATAGVKRKASRTLTENQQHVVYETGFLFENAVAAYILSPENQQQETDVFISLFGLEEQRKKDIEESSGALIRPGECMLDGVAMTPDAVNLKLFYVHEWKATAMRSKGFSIKERKPEWLWQVAAYCKVFGMTRAIIRVFHDGEFPQTISQWVVNFSQEEIDENWRQLLDHLEYMKSRVA